MSALDDLRKRFTAGTTRERPKRRININISISRSTRKPHRKAQIETKNTHIMVDAAHDHNGDAVRRLVRSHVSSAHPGWSLAGWCPAPRSI